MKEIKCLIFFFFNSYVKQISMNSSIRDPMDPYIAKTIIDRYKKEFYH